MTTPHEQTWMVFPGAANDMGQTAVTDSQHRMVALTRTEDGPELARLIAAAPDMTRLLMHLVAMAPEGTGDALVIRARETLHKAGVLP